MKRRPYHILVCNDDGIGAAGLLALVKEMKKLGVVTVVAPDKQQSAVGHAITMNSPLRITKVFRGKKFFGYAVSGTPADCVKIAIRAILKEKPDILVSGINHGSNTSINIIYSGTVSAATEGTILGIPSIAFSLTTYDKPDFHFAAKIAGKLAAMVLRKGIPAGTLLNVNIPPVPEKEIRGVKITRQGKTRWDDTFDVRRDPNNKEYYWLTGTLEIIDTSSDTDQIAVMNRYVSVTPIHYDLTNYRSLPALRRWKLNA
ncbi:MAG TPA: 5'/3'-nucleotidase SurE [Bacteroidota bacterium]|nr:5'/3'-nucleotidase SurE [Bacteroidota bacterium]